jgi:hypothetical protein
VSQVNLLPPEVLAGQRTRRLASLIVVGGAILVGLLFAFYLFQVTRLNGVEGDIADQQRTNNAIQDDIDALQKYEDLQVEAQQQQALLDAAYRDELSFSQALMDISRITPSDSYINSLGITVTGSTDTTGTTGTEGAPTFVGTLQLAGQAIGVDTVAQWITLLEGVTGWVNPWVPTVTTSDPALDVRDFTASVDLTPDALTPRGRGGETTDGG